MVISVPISVHQTELTIITDSNKREEIMADIFISYSSKDEQKANDICNRFENEGISCWIAPRDIEVGKEYGGEIIKGIEGCKVLFLCLSKAANESQHVLREVERAVNRNIPIVVYQYEETTLSKSMEYFLASTQWYIPGKDAGDRGLIEQVRELCEKNSQKKHKTNIKENSGKKKKTGIWGCVAAAVLLVFCCFGFFLLRGGTEVKEGDTFTYGSIDLTGSSKEELTWQVIYVDKEEKTALCLLEEIAAFFPYDGAESGMRGQCGDIYYNESKISEYTDEQLINFWGSSDWESSNIRSWLNSDRAIVEYTGAKPTENTVSLYENGYESQVGFLYSFTDKEKEQLVLTNIGNVQDKVFLLSYEEVMEYLVNQNRMLPTVPCDNAVLLEGTGIYKEYYDLGERSTYWALRTEGDNVCSVLCAGTGLGRTDNFHSEYACSSLMGIRPAVVLSVDYIEELLGK